MSELFADDAAYQAALQVPQGAQQDTSPPPTATAVAEPVPEPQRPSAPVEEIPEFDPRCREAFTGLLYVGALTRETTIFGHRFLLATPTQTELLQIGQVIKPFAETATGQLAYSTAMVAAYLVSVDGRDLPKPISTDPKDHGLQGRFDWVIENLRREVIQEIFSKTLELDAEVANVLEAMGKASG